MALSPGARLGSYEIVSMLGAGGMGQVYRARDLRLGRTVAIKVLLPSVAKDTERLSRFEREARALASLNHPNIAQLYGVDDGPDGVGLVMELVDGSTLAGRIAAGPIRLEEALSIAAQIAGAVEAAHDQGVIHRDLKPANVKVRADGVVKVLDFGLAKVMDPDSPHPSGATVTSPAMTSAGVILGTAAYMSPEQARGDAVDRRSDIWAFGCVLYEMLTRRQPFDGRTVTDVLAAIIEREPDWSVIPPSTPATVRRLLRRCLSKDPRNRLHDMADVRLEVEDALTSVNDAPKPAANANRKAWSAAVLLAAVAGGAAVWFIGQRLHSTAANGSSTEAAIERVTYDPGVTRMPALSPDGKLLAYASDRAGNGDLDIWIQQTAGGTPLRLTDDSADDSTPDFSPDGSQVVFRSERNGGGVYVVPALGGPARLLVADGRNPRFAPDGSRIAYWTGQFRGQNIAGHLSSVYVIPLAGGSPTRLLPDFDVASNPVWTTDGRSLIVAGRAKDRSTPIGAFDWWLVPADSGTPVKSGLYETAMLTGADAVAPQRATPEGILFSFRDDVWRVRLSPTGRLQGSPETLTIGVGPYIDPAAGPNGEVVFARLVTQRAVDRASLVNTAEPESRLYADSGSTTMRASGTPDGSAIVIEREAGAFREIWIKNTVSGRQELVVRVPTRTAVNATMSADGTRIAYTQEPDGNRALTGTGYVVEASGGVPRQVCDRCVPYGFLGDGRRLLAVTADGQAIRVIDVATGAARDLVVVPSGQRLDRPHASPDDRLLTFRTITGSAGKSFVTRMPSARAIAPADAAAIDEPTTTGRPAGWSLDSRTVYLLLDADGFRCLWAQRVDPESGAPIGKPVPVRHFHRTVGMSTSFGNAVTARGFMYEAADVMANLWKLQPRVRK